MEFQRMWILRITGTERGSDRHTDRQGQFGRERDVFGLYLEFSIGKKGFT